MAACTSPGGIGQVARGSYRSEWCIPESAPPGPHRSPLGVRCSPPHVVATSLLSGFVAGAGCEAAAINARSVARTCSTRSWRSRTSSASPLSPEAMRADMRAIAVAAPAPDDPLRAFEGLCTQLQGGCIPSSVPRGRQPRRARGTGRNCCASRCAGRPRRRWNLRSGGRGTVEHDSQEHDGDHDEEAHGGNAAPRASSGSRTRPPRPPPPPTS